jgi:hypothetical protein
MNARSMICASAIALAGGLSVSAPAHAALTLIVAAGGGGGSAAGNGSGGEITTSGANGLGSNSGAGGTNGSGGGGGTGGAVGGGGGAGWLSNGGGSILSGGGLTSPTFAGGLSTLRVADGGFGGGGAGDDIIVSSGGGGGGYSGGGGGSTFGPTGGGGGGSYVNPALGDVLETPDVNAGNGYVLVGTTYFGYTGSVEEYTILQAAFYFVAAVGAQGGSDNFGDIGGHGAAVGGEVYLTEGTELDIVVGGVGEDGAGATGFTGGGGGGSFVWDPTAIPVQPVPEPSTWAMMLLGFAGLGYAGWRARRQTVLV